MQQKILFVNSVRMEKLTSASEFWFIFYTSANSLIHNNYS